MQGASIARAIAIAGREIAIAGRGDAITGRGDAITRRVGRTFMRASASLSRVGAPALRPTASGQGALAWDKKDDSARVRGSRRGASVALTADSCRETATASTPDRRLHALDLVNRIEAHPAEPVWLTPNVLSAKHWTRLLGGALYAASSRVDWATPLRRSFEVDVLRCAGCGGRLRVLGQVTEPALVTLVLESLGVPTDAPKAAHARYPTELLGEAVDE